MTNVGRGVDLTNDDEVQEYIKNLGTEYRFGCYSEKDPKGRNKSPFYNEYLSLWAKVLTSPWKQVCLDHSKNTAQLMCEFQASVCYTLRLMYPGLSQSIGKGSWLETHTYRLWEDIYKCHVSWQCQSLFWTNFEFIWLESREGGYQLSDQSIASTLNPLHFSMPSAWGFHGGYKTGLWKGQEDLRDKLWRVWDGSLLS